MSQTDRDLAALAARAFSLRARVEARQLASERRCLAASGQAPPIPLAQRLPVEDVAALLAENTRLLESSRYFRRLRGDRS